MLLFGKRYDLEVKSSSNQIKWPKMRLDPAKSGHTTRDLGQRKSSFTLGLAVISYCASPRGEFLLPGRRALDFEWHSEGHLREYHRLTISKG